MRAALDAISPETRRRLALLALIQLVLIAGHVLIFAVTLGSADPDSTRQVLDFNQEWSIPTIYAALLMWAAGVVAFRRGAGRGAPWILLGLGMIALGFEELVQLHETLDEELEVDWPIIYAPALAVGAWALWRVARELPATARALLVGGLVLMAAAVGLELAGNLTDRLDGARNLAEENLELAGVGLVLAGLLDRSSDASSVR